MLTNITKIKFSFAVTRLPNYRSSAATKLAPLCGSLFYQPYSTKLTPLHGYQTFAALRLLLHCFINLILPNLRRFAALASLFYQSYSAKLTPLHGY